MSHNRFTSLLGATIVIAALGACSSSPTSSSPDTVSQAQINSDVANETAPDAASDAADFNDNGGYGATSFDVVAGMRKGMMADAGPCGPSTRDSIMYTFGANSQDTVNFIRTREWFAGGACEVAYDSTQTDSVEYVGTWNVALNNLSGNWSRHASRLRNSSVFGVPLLHTATSHTWNANAVVQDTVHFVGNVNTRSYSGLAYDTATAVTFNHPRNGEVYPESGTWTRWGTWTLNVSGATTKSVTVQRHVVVTFSGGSNDATLQLYDVSTGTLALTCTLDLLAREVVPGTCH